MTTLHRHLFLLFVMALTAAPAVAQPDSCPVIVETALTQADSVCNEVGRNQACYGHTALTAQPIFDDPNFSFDQEGDVVGVSSLLSLRLSPMDELAGIWGVALLRIQANLPDTLPGQNVMMLLFGDTEITNAVKPQTFLDVIANSSSSVYVDPSRTSAVLNTLAPGQTVMASARTPENDWLRVQLLDGTSGWVSAGAMQSSGDLSLLNVVEVGQPPYQPMQAFYLRTGIGKPACSEAPTSGILVQTPEGARSINLSINHVRVEMASTLFFHAEADSQMVVSVLEGAGLVDAQGEFRPMVAGGRVRIPLDENLNPSGAPGAFEPYDDAVVAPLPVAHLERAIDIAPALAQDDADLVNRFAADFERLGVENYDTLFKFIHDNKDTITEDMVRRFVDQLLGITTPVAAPTPQVKQPVVQPEVQVEQPSVIEITPEVIVPTEDAPPADTDEDKDTTDTGDDIDGGDNRDIPTRDDDTQTGAAGDNTDEQNTTNDAGVLTLDLDLRFNQNLRLDLIVPTPTLVPIK